MRPTFQFYPISVALLLNHAEFAVKGATRPVTLMIPSSAYPLRCAPLLYSEAMKSIYSIDDVGEPWGREPLSGRTSPVCPSSVRFAFRPSRKRLTLVGLLASLMLS
jgi:hypothetical protein